jgi:hypothetical protein
VYWLTFIPLQLRETRGCVAGELSRKETSPFYWLAAREVLAPHTSTPRSQLQAACAQASVTGTANTLALTGTPRRSINC